MFLEKINSNLEYQMGRVDDYVCRLFTMAHTMNQILEYESENTTRRKPL